MKINLLTHKWIFCAAAAMLGAQYASLTSAMELEAADNDGMLRSPLPSKILSGRDFHNINDYYQFGEMHREKGEKDQALACYLKSKNTIVANQDQSVKTFFKNWSYEALYLLGDHLHQRGNAESELDLTKVLFSILNERDSNELKENIYTLYHLESAFNLIEPDFNGDENINTDDNMRGKWRFFPVDGKEMTFRIQNLETAHYIMHNNQEITFLSEPDEKNTQFYWKIIKDPDRSSFKICSYNENHYLYYDLCHRDNHTKEVGMLLLGDKPSSGLFNSWEWTFNPRYSSSGYIDFSQIANDLGLLLVNRYKSSILGSDLLTIRELDMNNLTSQCEEITNLKVDRNNANYKSYRREVFRSTDHSEILHREGSRVTISREIKTEESFQTSLNRSLEQAKTKNINQATRTAKNKQNAKGLENEKHSTASLLKAITSLLRVNVVDYSEESKRKGTSNSYATHESQTDHSEMMKSEGNSEAANSSKRITEGTNWHASGSASIEAGFMGVKGSVSMTGGGGGHKDNAHEESYGTTTTSEIRKTESKTTTKGADQTNSTTEEDEARQANTKERGMEKNNLFQQDSEQGQREMRSTHQIEGGEEELTYNTMFTMESRRNVTNLLSQTKKTEETWYIERQLIQAQNSKLEVIYYEEDVEIANYPFEIEIRLSGKVGFHFNRPFGAGSQGVARSTQDMRDSHIWYLTPATIIKYLPAPGFVAQQDGSVIYKARGSLNLKKPIRVYGIINEIPLTNQIDYTICHSPSNFTFSSPPHGVRSMDELPANKRPHTMAFSNGQICPEETPEKKRRLGDYSEVI